MNKIQIKGDKLTYRATPKHCFDYDLAEVTAYVDQESREILTDLVLSSELISKFNLMENVKGSEEIKLLNSTPTLQAATNCGRTPSGGVVFLDETITTKRVKIEEIYCNEDLNSKWTQLYNKSGANAQDENQPDFADIMISYYRQKAMKRTQDLVILGDTASLDSNLAHIDGLVKLWENDADLNVIGTPETSITVSNAFDLAITLHEGIPEVLLDNEVEVEIWVGRETYRKIINNVYNDNNFHYTIEEETGSMPSFILPTTNTRVRSIPQFTGTDNMYAVPYEYVFFATDLSSDVDGFEFKYSVYADELYFGTKWRVGVQYVFPEYFTRLRLTPTS